MHFIRTILAYTLAVTLGIALIPFWLAFGVL